MHYIYHTFLCTPCWKWWVVTCSRWSRRRPRGCAGAPSPRPDKSLQTSSGPRTRSIYCMHLKSEYSFPLLQIVIWEHWSYIFLAMSVFSFSQCSIIYKSQKLWDCKINFRFFWQSDHDPKIKCGSGYIKKSQSGFERSKKKRKTEKSNLNLNP